MPVAAGSMVQHCVCDCQFHGATLCLWLPVPWCNIVSVTASSMVQHYVCGCQFHGATLRVCGWCNIACLLRWFLGVKLVVPKIGFEKLATMCKASVPHEGGARVSHWQTQPRMQSSAAEENMYAMHVRTTHLYTSGPLLRTP